MKLLFGTVIFLSSFLLFLTQPFISKYLLPFFGGGSSVWIIALLFFQCFLLLGYSYSHFVVNLSNRKQVLLHIGLLIVFLSLQLSISKTWPTPILPSKDFATLNLKAPEASLLATILAAIGYIYFFLSSTSPIIQSWYHKKTGQSPYWLYRVSNTGSFLAIASYPIIIEQKLTIIEQSSFIVVIYLLFLFLISLVGLLLWKLPAERRVKIKSQKVNKISRKKILFWIFAASLPSGALMAFTNHLTQEINPSPIIWMFPLGLYLLSFIVTFKDDFRISKVAKAFFLLVLLTTLFLKVTKIFVIIPIFFSIFFFLTSLFVISVYLHHKLYLNKPRPEQLTSFYFYLSLGGAIGGIMVGVVSPLIFPGFWEVDIALLLGSLVLLRGRSLQRLSLMQSISGALVLFIVVYAFKDIKHNIFMDRNFYGTLKIREMNGWTALSHGGTVHGTQYTDENLIFKPTAYYSENSGLGIVMEQIPKDSKIAALGMGVGTVASYCNEENQITFYEINPMVIKVAHEYFSFLKNCSSSEKIIIGDARLSLENNFTETYDLIIVDVFNDDTIPVHLITNEAIALYLNNLTPNGVLAINISNRHLDLKKPLKRIAENNSLYMAAIYDDYKLQKTPIYPSEWVILSYDQDFITKRIQPKTNDQKITFMNDISTGQLWTDNFNNTLSALRF